DQPFRSVALRAANEDEDDGGGAHAADEGGERQRKDADAVADPGDDRDGSGSRPGRQTEEERVGEIVAGDGLEQQADDAESRADCDREDRARQAQVHDDAVDRPRIAGGEAECAGKRGRYLRKGDDGRSVDDGGGGQRGHRDKSSREADAETIGHDQKASGWSALAILSMAAILSGPGVSSS